MEIEYVAKDLNLINLTKYISKFYKKKSKKAITCADVQGYVKRKQLPKYMGGATIVENKEITSVKLYSIAKL